MTRSLNRRGANAIEFALIMPVLALLFTGIIDYGWIYLIRTSAVTAARAGARAGAFTVQTGGPESIASTAALNKWNSLGVPVVVTTPDIVAFRTGTPELMVVRVSVDTGSLIGLVPQPTGDIIVTASQPMEDQP